ncbi:hypothetical protein ENBRE01_0511 [Enteropsectra breve]|nr:hypothetical protein ENBRE01_0511 [Enteropsectra breve]
MAFTRSNRKAKKAGKAQQRPEGYTRQKQKMDLKRKIDKLPADVIVNCCLILTDKDKNFSDKNFSDKNFSDKNFSDKNFRDKNFSICGESKNLRIPDDNRDLSIRDHNKEFNFRNDSKQVSIRDDSKQVSICGVSKDLSICETKPILKEKDTAANNSRGAHQVVKTKDNLSCESLVNEGTSAKLEQVDTHSIMPEILKADDISNEDLLAIINQGRIEECNSQNILKPSLEIDELQSITSEDSKSSNDMEFSYQHICVNKEISKISNLISFYENLQASSDAIRENSIVKSCVELQQRSFRFSDLVGIFN